MMESRVEQFLRRNVDGQPNFPFDEFFTEFELILHEKLALHGVLSFEEYVTCLTRYYDMHALDQFAYESTHINFKQTPDDLKQVLFRNRYDAFHSTYVSNPTYCKLLDLYERLQLSSNLDEKAQVFLADECIHAMHNSGSLLGVDVESIKKKIDELCVDKLFGILTRNGVEERLVSAKKPFNCVLLDFEAIRELNESHGYEWVNQTMRKLFATFPHSSDTLIGRYFSGDEIVIITYEDPAALSASILSHAERHGLKASSRIFQNLTSISALSFS